jgi:hypothetical protein
MIKNISYKEPSVRTEIDSLVGRPYPLTERIRMGGIGSPRFMIRETSAPIMALLNLDHNTNYCNLELRPGGIIARFRSILETYAWIVPYSRLSIIRSEGVVTLYSGEYFMRLLSTDHSKSHGAFIRRLIRRKAEASRDLFPF